MYVFSNPDRETEKSGRAKAGKTCDKEGKSMDVDGSGCRDDAAGVAVRGVDPGSVFFVVNPDGDLANTQRALQQPLGSRAGWSGVAGAAPTLAHYQAGLTQRDLFM